MQKTTSPDNLRGLVWITGLSGAGKTTIAEQLVSRLKRKHVKPVWLDGDTLRKALLIERGFSRSDRLKIARQYCNLAKTFVDQQHLVVCSTISLFDEVHAWNRANISPYLEVFLDVPDTVRAERDTKGHYRGLETNETTDFAGSHFTVDIPKAPDLHIPNFGDYRVEDTLELVWQKLDALQINSSNQN